MRHWFKEPRRLARIRTLPGSIPNDIRSDKLYLFNPNPNPNPIVYPNPNLNPNLIPNMRPSTNSKQAMPIAKSRYGLGWG